MDNKQRVQRVQELRRSSAASPQNRYDKWREMTWQEEAWAEWEMMFDA